MDLLKQIGEMYSIDGVYKNINREDNNGQTAIITDKYWKSGLFNRSYYFRFRFTDGFEDSFEISYSSYVNMKIGDSRIIKY